MYIIRLLFVFFNLNSYNELDTFVLHHYIPIAYNIGTVITVLYNMKLLNICVSHTHYPPTPSMYVLITII